MTDHTVCMTDAQPITFSVVVALHNKAEFVSDAIASIVGQTYPALEILVVDDGSTDGGAEVVRALDVPNLRLIEQANAGPGPARNRALAEAKADYCAFLDADDLWLDDHLECLRTIAQSFPEAMLIGTDYREFDGPPPTLDRGTTPAPRDFAYFNEQLDCSRIWTGSAAVMTRPAQSIDGFGDFCPGEDRWLWQTLAFSGPVAVCDRVTALYRRQTGGIMEQIEQDRKFTWRVPPVIQQLDDYVVAFPSDQDAPAIRRYRDKQWSLSLRQYIYRGQIDSARQIAAGMRDRGIEIPGSLRALLMMPAPALRLGLVLYRNRSKLGLSTQR